MNCFPFNNFKFLSLSFQSSFHLSLVVLVCYRSPTVYLALDGVYHLENSKHSEFDPVIFIVPFLSGCTFKQPDSFCPRSFLGPFKARIHYGNITLSVSAFPGKLPVPFKVPLDLVINTTIPIDSFIRTTSLFSGLVFRILGLGFFPLHSPLLWESRLFSFPPLIKMLQFSG